MVLTAPPRQRQFQDQSWGKLSPRQIKDAGYQGTMGYVSDDPTKNLTKRFVEECQALDLEVYVVWQSGKEEPLGGAIRGRYVAPKARALVRGLGLPDTMPIRYASDFAPAPTDRKQVETYYLTIEQIDQQAAQGAGLTRAYGADYVLNWMGGIGIPGDWQCAAWSGATHLDGMTYNGRISPWAGALQMPQHQHPGTSVWIDDNWLLDGKAFHGSKDLVVSGVIKPARPLLVGVMSTPSGKGYWEVTNDGGIFAYGDAGYYGSGAGLPLAKPVTCAARTPSGKGYWLACGDGGVLAYGDAPFYGSLGGVVLAAPVVGIAPTPSGRGYWLSGSDGGIFAFGDATYQGNVSEALRLAYP